MRVLFHLSSLNIGGAEMSSLKWIHALNEQGVAVTLVLTEGNGALLPRVPSGVDVLVLRPGRRSENWAIRPLRGMLGVLNAMRLLFRRFDAAIVGLTGTPTWLVEKFVRAPRKMHFIRNDLSKMGKQSQIKSAIKRNSRSFTAFICVSQVAHRSLVEAVPEVASKSVIIYNLIDAEGMKARAKLAESPFPLRRPGVVRVLSVCRLNDRAKGLLRMVNVAACLRDAGLAFEWFIAGDGPDRGLLEQAIQQAGLQQHLILLGRLENPFPAYEDCDLVAMLSYYEGLCGVINEAKVMGRAVIATQVSGVDEQLVNEKTGLIVAQKEEAIVEGMQRLLLDDGLRLRLSGGKLPAALMDDKAKLLALMNLFDPALGRVQ